VENKMTPHTMMNALPFLLFCWYGGGEDHAVKLVTLRNYANEAEA